MEAGSQARILVVANKTAATPTLVEAVRQRAAKGPASFTLLVPAHPHGLHRVVDPEDQGDDEAAKTIAQARPLLEEAAGSDVEAIVGDAEPLAAVEDAVNAGSYDEIILSTLPATLSRWLKLDLPSKVSGLGLPLTVVTPED